MIIRPPPTITENADNCLLAVNSWRIGTYLPTRLKTPVFLRAPRGEKQSFPRIFDVDYSPWMLYYSPLTVLSCEKS